MNDRELCTCSCFNCADAGETHSIDEYCIVHGAKGAVNWTRIGPSPEEIRVGIERIHQALVRLDRTCTQKNEWAAHCTCSGPRTERPEQEEIDPACSTHKPELGRTGVPGDQRTIVKFLKYMNKKSLPLKQRVDS